MNARVVRLTELVSRSAVSCSCPLDDVCKADRQGTSVRPTNATSLRRKREDGQDGCLSALPVSSESGVSWLKLVPFVRPTEVHWSLDGHLYLDRLYTPKSALEMRHYP